MGSPTVKTTCPYCGVGCGVLATRRGDGGVEIKGDPEHPANLGRLCSKGAALGETLSLDDRLLHPEIGGQRASWDKALGLVAQRFSQTIAEHGPDSVAFYVSGQLLTEDYYVANKLMKGFIGSANIDTNSRLCMASSVAGHKRAFGSDTVPGTYEDLEQADLVVLVGSNLAWCHPVLYQRLAAAREARGTKVVVIDPRRTATCEIADLHLGDQAGFGRGVVQWAADQPRRRQRGRQDIRVRPHVRFSRGLCNSAFNEFFRHRTGNGIAPLADARVLRSVHGDRARRHGLQPGRQSIDVGNRQGQRHHQLPSGDGPDRPAGHGTVLGHGTAQRDGRARSWWPGQHAGRPHGPRQCRAPRDRADVLARATHGQQTRTEGGRSVPRGRRWPHQGAVDHGDQSRRQHAASRRRPRGDRGLPVRRRLRCGPPNRYDGARARPVAGDGMGREGRHGD